MKGIKNPPDQSGNCVRRFLFDDLDIRGAIVRADSVWQDLIADRNYPEPVRALLGQMCAITLLLADNLKQPGRLTIQLRGKGPVSLLVVDCDETLNIRCLAQHAEKIPVAPQARLFGEGQLLLSLDRPTMREPQQSIVPLNGETVAEIFTHYLAQSEQIESRLFLAASPTGIAGLFLQKMPSTDERDADGWHRIEALASTVKESELIDLPTDELLVRLFHEETIRLFDAQAVTSERPEDWEKVGNMLRALGREEVYAALKERGVIIIRDDLANREYRFEKPAIDALFVNTPETPATRH